MFKKTRTFTLAAFALSAAALQAQTSEIFTASHNETNDGPFNQGRVHINADFNGTILGQWLPRGNAGTSGTGSVWHGFSRYKMFQRDLFNKIDAADSITRTTGLVQKEKNRAIDAVNGGHDVDVYLVLDPAGGVVPSGSEPTHATAWDWANELGMGYENTVYLGRVLQSEPMATAEEKTAEDTIPVDSPAMRISFDLTPTLKDWIQQGLLTSESTIAVGLVQRQADIADDQGNPRVDDPNLYIHSQMVFEVSNAFLATSTGGSGTPKGPGVFADYDLTDGWVNTGEWLGLVEVSNYPWAYILDLAKYVWFPEASDWVFVPN
jgi:hypothetical protein